MHFLRLIPFLLLLLATQQASAQVDPVASQVVQEFIANSGGESVWNKVRTCFARAYVENWDTTATYADRSAGDTTAYWSSAYYKFPKKFLTYTQYPEGAAKENILSGSDGQVFWMGTEDSVEHIVPGVEAMIADRSVSHNRAFYLLKHLQTERPLQAGGIKEVEGRKYRVIDVFEYSSKEEYWFDQQTGLLSDIVNEDYNRRTHFSDYRWVEVEEGAVLVAFRTDFYKYGNHVSRTLRSHVVFNRSMTGSWFSPEEPETFKNRHFFFETSLGIAPSPKTNSLFERTPKPGN